MSARQLPPRFGDLAPLACGARGCVARVHALAGSRNHCGAFPCGPASGATTAPVASAGMPGGTRVGESPRPGPSPPARVAGSQGKGEGLGEGRLQAGARSAGMGFDLCRSGPRGRTPPRTAARRARCTPLRPRRAGQVARARRGERASPRDGAEANPAPAKRGNVAIRHCGGLSRGMLGRVLASD
jgi:hypothetical protein